MEIFRRRPLCFFCFLFAAASLFASSVGYKAKLILLCVGGGAVLLCAAAYFLLRERRVGTVFAVLCLLSVMSATASSAFRMDYQKMRAEEYVGERIMVADIISEEYSSERYTVYGVKISRLDGQEVNFKASLALAFKAELSVGDRAYAKAELISRDDDIAWIFSKRLGGEELLVTAAVYEKDHIIVEPYNGEQPLYMQLFGKNGFSVATNRLGTSLKERINTLFGRDGGALVIGFLLGDTSEIPTGVIRNFRRSGVSHLLAVSGLHINILLGTVELLLRRLHVGKRARCITVSVLSVVFLALTGFSPSAARAVFMLWIAYAVFMLAEEADSPTTLFIALAMILIIFPYSVYELGMWMSFLATLGLVTVYPFFQGLIPLRRGSHLLTKRLYRIFRAVLLTVCMTVISNMLLLSIQWYFFGEISLSSIPANILLSPVTTVYMVTFICALALGGIPLVGDVAVWLTNKLTALILLITEELASIDGAVVSLKYRFAGVLVVLFAVTFAVLLTVRLRKKWLIGLPIVCFTAAFCVCLGVYGAVAPKTVKYYGTDENKLISVSDKSSLGLIDMSNGAYGGFSNALYGAGETGATDVDFIVFTNISARHISSMDYFLRNSVVKKLYIPMPSSDNPSEIEYAKELTALSLECGTEVELYGDGDVLTLGGICLKLNFSDFDGRKSMFVSVLTSERLFCYADACMLAENRELQGIAANADTLMIGGDASAAKAFKLTLSENTELIYASEEIMNVGKITAAENNIYCRTDDSAGLTVRMN